MNPVVPEADVARALTRRGSSNGRSNSVEHDLRLGAVTPGWSRIRSSVSSRCAVSRARTRSIALASPATVYAARPRGGARRPRAPRPRPSAHRGRAPRTRAWTSRSGPGPPRPCWPRPPLEPVDAALDRRRRQRHAQPDALERPPRVLTEQRNDLPVDLVRRHNGTLAQRIAVERAAGQRNHERTNFERRSCHRAPAVAAPKAAEHEDYCRCTASTTSSSTWATRCSPRSSTSTRSASRRSPTPASRPACATAPRTCSSEGRIRLVLTGALTPGHEIGAHQAAHGDGVKVIAPSVPDVEHAYREATARSATGVREALRGDRRGRHDPLCRSPPRRDAAHLRRPQRIQGFRPGYTPASAPPATSACSPSTTSSATSSSARWPW